jgi:hypothetical protein
VFRPLTRTLILASLCLVLAAPAQARPTGLVHRDGGWVKTDTAAQATQQPVHVVVTKSDDGFNYLDAGAGAVIAAGMAGIFVIALRRPHRRVAV